MFSVLQSGADVTRPTFWQIGPVGKAVFYYLAVVVIAVFVLSTYQRVKKYSQGEATWVDRLDNLGARTVSAARTMLSNRTLFDRDIVGGVMHTMIMWGFLTLLIATTILGIDMDLSRPLTGQSFFFGVLYHTY
jgi:hypothetical protein